MKPTIQITTEVEAVLQTMKSGPCIAAQGIAKLIEKGKQEIHSLYLEENFFKKDLFDTVTGHLQGNPHLLLFIPYPGIQDKISSEKLHDVLHHYYTHIMDAFLNEDSEPNIGNPFSKDYYYSLGGKEIFSLLLTKTSNRNGRKLDNDKNFCILLQDRASFGSGPGKDKLAEKIRKHPNNIHLCPFHKLKYLFYKKSHLYPQEMTHFASHPIEGSITNFGVDGERSIYTTIHGSANIKHFDPMDIINADPSEYSLSLENYEKIINTLEHIPNEEFISKYLPASSFVQSSSFYDKIAISAPSRSVGTDR